MGDLLAATLILTGASLGFVWLGMRLAGWQKGRYATCIALVGVTLTLWFAVSLHGRLTIVRWLPVSSAIVLGNWIPLGTGLLAGVMLGYRRVPRWRRRSFALILLSMGWYAMLQPLMAKPPASHHSWWLADVARQSSAASCGPCCAITLLRHCAIPCDEAEMMALCLTNCKGTSSLGLYRGLKLKTRGTEWEVEVVSGNIQSLRRTDQWPVLLQVRCAFPGPGVRSPFHRLLESRKRHTVVMFRFTEDGQADIADPAEILQERRKWPLDVLKQRWTGEGLRLVKRRSTRGTN